MPTGSQGTADGLALQVVDYVRDSLARSGTTIEALARGTGMSKNYLSTRLRGERVLNLRDFERLAAFFELSPQEFLARVRFPLARDYQGRLTASFGVTVDERDGMQLYVVDDITLPRKRDVGTDGDDDPHTTDLSQEDLGLAASEDDTAVDPDSRQP